jgi:hypothetical protein
VSDLELRGVWLAVGVLAGLLGAAALPRLLRAMGLERTNFQDRPIGAAAGVVFLVAGFCWLVAGPHGDLPYAVAVSGFGLLGLIDDRWGGAEFKGLRGHLRALTQGRVTTGLLKAVGGLALAGLLGWWIRPGLSALSAALLIALCANLFNLLDLRPLRTLKLFWLLGAGLMATGSALLALIFGVSLPYARLEARRAVMLGDVGANSLGALIGVSLIAVLPVLAQGVIVALLLAFHIWAEKHSLSVWISTHSWAEVLDGWGWRDGVP